MIQSRIANKLFFGWVIVGVAFAVFMVMSGVWGSFSVFYVALVDEFGWSRAETAGAFSVYMMAQGLSAPIAGWLADRFGPRRLMPVGAVILAMGMAAASQLTEPWHLYVLYGLLVAFGQSCVGFIPHLRLISNWFNRRRGTAIGIATAGFGFGTLVIIPFLQFLILQIGWRQTYLVLAGMVLLLAPLTGLMHRQRPSEMGLLPDGENAANSSVLGSGERTEDIQQAASSRPQFSSPFADCGPQEAIGTGSFRAMMISNVFFGLATIISVFQVAHMVQVGFPPMIAASVSGLAGLLLAIGRMLGGVMADRVGKTRTGLIGVSLISVAVTLVILAGIVREPWLLFVYAVFYGVGWGFFGIVGASITAELFQGRSYGTIAGLLEFGVGMGGFLGPLLGGFLFDALGSYNVTLSAAVLSAWAGALCFRLAYRGISLSRERTATTG